MVYGLTPLVPLSRCERGITSRATSILELSPSHFGGGVWGEVDWVRSIKHKKYIYELIKLKYKILIKIDIFQIYFVTCAP